MEDSIGIGDTHHDVAFLEAVKNPVAINPNNRLAKMAAKNSWKIFSTQSKGIVSYIEGIA